MLEIKRLPSDEPGREEYDVMFAVQTPLRGSEPETLVKVVLTNCNGICLTFPPRWPLGDKTPTDGGYLYSDQATALHEALTMALKEMRRRRNRKPTQKEVDEFVGDFASTLTLNRNAAERFIKSAKWRKRKGGGVEVRYNGKWLHLCRTDLKDDVRTWTSAIAGPGIDPNIVNHIDHYRKTVAYGARITDRAFFIVDAFSDG